MITQQKRITIKTQNNPKAAARYYLIMHVGENIQISDIEEVTKDQCKVLLRAVLPYRLTLENGDNHVGYVKFDNIGSFMVFNDKGLWKVDKSSTVSLCTKIDKKLREQANDYRRLLTVKELMWV